MHNIGSGVASKDDSGVWQILDANGTLQAEFIHAMFSFIENGTHVYFVDLDLDRLCENVQLQLDVNELVLAATPYNGFASDSELRLRNYIMDALLASLQRTDDARAAYRTSLAQKMDLIAERANVLPSKKVTVALLKKLGVAG